MFLFWAFPILPVLGRGDSLRKRALRCDVLVATPFLHPLAFPPTVLLSFGAWGQVADGARTVLNLGLVLLRYSIFLPRTNSRRPALLAC